MQGLVGRDWQRWHALWELEQEQNGTRSLFLYHGLQKIKVVHQRETKVLCHHESDPSHRAAVRALKHSHNLDTGIKK